MNEISHSLIKVIFVLYFTLMSV